MTPEEAIASFRARYAARPDVDDALEAVEEELLRRWPRGDDDYTVLVSTGDLVRVFRRMPLGAKNERRFTSAYVWRLEDVPAIIDRLEGRQ